jgi:hypothetical protein
MPETTTPVTPTTTPSTQADATESQTPDTPGVAPTLLVVARLKEYAARAGLRTGGEFIEEFNAEVLRLVDRSINRCNRSGRKTLNGSDA